MSTNSIEENEILIPQNDDSHPLQPTSPHQKPYKYIDQVEATNFLLPSTLKVFLNSFQPFFSFIRKYQGGSVSDGVLALLAATIGTGILMIPNSIAASGAVWGSIQMIICAILSYHSLIILVKCASHLNVSSYQDLALKTYGHWCRQMVNLTSFFANWGSAILYLKLISELFAVSTAIFVGNNLPAWMITPESKILPVVIATVFVLPLSVAKELKALRYFCIINMGFILFFCFVVFYQGFEYQPFWEGLKTINLFTLTGFSTTFPSAVFAYMSHTNLLDVFKELENPSVDNMKKIIRTTILFVLFTYIIIGVIGYSTFASNIGVLSSTEVSNGIILLAYGHDLDGAQRPYPGIVVISMVTMSVSIIISQPFNIRPAKEGLKNFLSSISEATKDPQKESTTQRFIYIAVTLYSCVFVTVYSESIQMIINILGSSFFSLICFIFPALFYLKVYKDTITTKDKIVHYFMLFLSILFAVWSTGDNIMISFGPKERFYDNDNVITNG